MKEDCFVKQEDENPMAEKETMLVKEPHKEFIVTAITDTTADIVIENKRNHDNTDAYKQQNVSSPELKEKWEKTNTVEATDTAPEAVETSHDEADMVVKKEVFDDGDKLHRMIIFGNLPLNLKRNREESPEEQGIVQKHEKVFQDLPIKIPLNRENEHPIEVKKGSDPVNIKSCRYPHHQKIELENMLHVIFEMWEARACRSRNPGIRQQCPSLSML